MRCREGLLMVLGLLASALIGVGCADNDWVAEAGDGVGEPDGEELEGPADAMGPEGPATPDETEEPIDAPPDEPEGPPPVEGEACDGRDDDLDGAVDEGCPCLPGDVQPCYPGAEDPVGICAEGEQLCEGQGEFGEWGECLEAVTPSEEVCGDGIDQDCDGEDELCATIEEACASLEHVEREVSLPFDNPGGCPWRVDDNLGSRGGHCQARTEQVGELVLPEDAVLCGMDFHVAESAMYYDDHLMITFDDVVLASSLDPSRMPLEADEGLYFYDWALIGGMDVAGGGLYCLGEAEGLGSCGLPGTESRGTITLELGEELVMRLAARFADEPSHEFMVITTGDDNPESDCRHSPFDMVVTYRYVLMP